MAWLPFAKLEITDGTTTINLLNNGAGALDGFCITDWQPAIQGLKAGGTWADPPTADERELIVSQLANAEEQYTFDVGASSPNGLIAHLRTLRAMLQKARQYTTTTWQDTSVYIIAQGYGETFSRKTRIKNWSTPADGFPYGPPMWDTIQGNAIDDFQIVIERGAWSQLVPGLGTATELSAVEAYDGRNLGNVDLTGTRDPTTANEVYIANKRNVANLSDIYKDDGGAWGANRMGAVPFQILPAVPAAGDATYFGIDTALADSGPFCSLVFDISIAGTGYTAVWEYWNGAWVALTVDDHTATVIPFDTLGVNPVAWVQPSDWATRALNLDGGPAITGYFVRVRVTAIPGALAAPTQQNRDIYSCVWPYVEIQEAAVEGDIPALARIQNYLHGFLSGSGSFERIVFGLRSISRGTDFSAYINYADEQNDAGITIASAGGFANNVEAATGRDTTVATGGLTAGPSIQIDQALSASYRGKFHIYIRAKTTSAPATDTYVRLLQTSGDTHIIQTDDVFFKATTDFHILDMGAMTLDPFPGHPIERIQLTTFVGTIGAATTVAFYDMILLPVDEMAADINSGDSAAASPGKGTRMTNDDFLDIDPITLPKKTPFLSYIRDDTIAGDPTRYGCMAIANGPSVMQANAHQRFWFFAMQYESTLNYYFTSGVTGISSILIEKNQRYWSMRGTD